MILTVVVPRCCGPGERCSKGTGGTHEEQGDAGVVKSQEGRGDSQ